MSGGLARVISATLLVASVSAGVGLGQPQSTSRSASASLIEMIERPVPLRQSIGAAHEPVTTSSAKAQSYYDQGLAYLHSFGWIDAARSFNEALRLDSRLAM